MRQDLAWPGLSDLGPRGPLFEYTLRVFDGGWFAAVAVGIYWLLAAWPTPSPEELNTVPRALLSLWRLPPFGALFAVPAAGLGAWLFPSRWLLGKPAGMNWWAAESGPAGRGAEHSLNAVRESSYWGALSLALVLAAISGPLANLTVLLLFAPLVVFRLYSQLWTSMDLAEGQVSYHRCFFGLTLTRPGPDLSAMEAVISGQRIQRPEEPVRFGVYIIGPRWQRIPLNTQYESREASYEAGMALSLQLDVPHYRLLDQSRSIDDARTLDDLNADRRPLWDPISLAFPYPAVRDRLPEEGEV